MIPLTSMGISTGMFTGRRATLGNLKTSVWKILSLKL